MGDDESFKILKTLLFYVYESFAYVYVCAFCPLSLEEGVTTLELELQMVMWVLRTSPQVLSIAESTLSHWAVSPDPQQANILVQS